MTLGTTACASHQPGSGKYGKGCMMGRGVVRPVSLRVCSGPRRLAEISRWDLVVHCQTFAQLSPPAEAASFHVLLPALQRTPS